MENNKTITTTNLKESSVKTQENKDFNNENTLIQTIFNDFNITVVKYKQSSTYRKKYKENNKERLKIIQQRYIKKNREIVNQRRRRYYEKNKERISKYQKERREQQNDK